MSEKILEIITLQDLQIKRPDLYKKMMDKTKTKKMGFCCHCQFFTKTLIKCTKCKDKYCLSCLTEITKNNKKNVYFCYECLQDFVNNDVDLILTKN